ncbi:MAG: chloride channel protein [Clostridia bacterium]|nr:chloride channel protein [Clostridia bacterium]
MSTTSRKYSSHVRQILIPCFVLSAITGILTGGIIFLFRICAAFVIEKSDLIYGYVRANPAFLPLLLLGAAALGGIAYLLMRFFPSCRGGDAQTTITVLRGFIPLKWLPNTIILFISSLLSYFSGIPLGEEGTSVQLGAAVGKGTVKLFSSKKRSARAWDRYIMTGGACGGFAAATGAPLTAILFAFDEAHRRFSPIIFMATATATLSSWGVLQCLCALFNVEARLFVLETPKILPMRYLWAPVIVGILCGLLAILFAKGYTFVDRFLEKTLKKVPQAVKIISAFVIIALFGFISADLIGSGHNIIHHLIDGHAPVWYLLLLYLAVRSVVFLFVSSLEITGGLSVPAMAVGAIVGSISAKALTAIGIFPEEYASVLVIVGVCSFMAATNRAPLNAMTFGCEALFGFTNLISIAIGVAFAFIVIEPLGVTAFSDIVIEDKIHTASHGKEVHVVDAHFTARSHAFITGKEVRDILWPANCAVLSVDKQDVEHPTIQAGDVLHIRYRTFDPEETYKTIESIVGRQKVDPGLKDVHQGDENYTIPEP